MEIKNTIDREGSRGQGEKQPFPEGNIFEYGILKVQAHCLKPSEILKMVEHPFFPTPWQQTSSKVTGLQLKATRLRLFLRRNS